VAAVRSPRDKGVDMCQCSSFYRGVVFFGQQGERICFAVDMSRYQRIEELGDPFELGPAADRPGDRTGTNAQHLFHFVEQLESDRGRGGRAC
jgi:hypothetical protein